MPEPAQKKTGRTTLRDLIENPARSPEQVRQSILPREERTGPPTEIVCWRPSSTAGQTNPVRFPFYHLVPKEPEEHFRWREKVMRVCGRSRAEQKAILEICSEDFLFWVNTFGYIFEPRCPNPEQRYRPFNTWPFQDQIAAEVIAAAGKGDLFIRKSRDMGVTWLMIYILRWFWQFQRGTMIVLASEKAEKVTKRDDPDSLLYKVDFTLGANGNDDRNSLYTPEWACPAWHRGTGCVICDDNDSVINGTATTGGILRGGRKFCAFLDEFWQVRPSLAADMLQATQEATQSRIIVSTPLGYGHPAAEIWESSGTAWTRIDVPWELHPLKIRGWYISDGKQLKPDHRGKIRSPEYDLACARAVHPSVVSCEWDRDIATSDSTFFPDDLLIRISGCCRRADARGDLRQDGSKIWFVRDDNGPLHLWFDPSAPGIPENETYAIGLDVGTGTGYTNSVAVVVATSTNEVVAEYARPDLMPHEFAVVAVRLARWFNQAKLIWERNGPGAILAKVIASPPPGLDYWKVYYGQDGLDGSHSGTPKLGWYCTRQGNVAAMRQLLQWLDKGWLVERSPDAMREYPTYVYTTTQDVVSRKSLYARDPSGARSNHADRVTSRKLVIFLLRPPDADKGKPAERAVPQRRLPPPRLEGPPANSLEYRMAIRMGTNAFEDEYHEERLEESW